VIHVPTLFDYRLCPQKQESRDNFITYLLEMRGRLGAKCTKVSYNKSRNLEFFVKHEDLAGVPFVPAARWRKFTSHSFGGKLTIRRKGLRDSGTMMSDGSDADSMGD
jgi:hypothetical protein